MGRAPCCEKVGLKRGRWTAEEDDILTQYIQSHGEGSWRSLPKNAGLLRCGKSCRLRWVNYLKSDLKRGKFSSAEDEIIIRLHASLGNRWSIIAASLPGRTDNEIKNYWNSHLSRQIHTFRRPISSRIQQPPPTFMDLPKPIGVGNSIDVAPKQRGGRTSRYAMKKNKFYYFATKKHYSPPPLPPPKLLETTSTGREFKNGGILLGPIPPTPTLEEETSINIVVKSSMHLDAHEDHEESRLGSIFLDSCFNDTVIDGVDVGPNGGVLQTLGGQTKETENGPPMDPNHELKAHHEDVEISKNSETTSNHGCFFSSSNSYINEEQMMSWGWDYLDEWDWNGGVEEQDLWEGERMSWLWDDNTGDDEGNCTSNSNNILLESEIDLEEKNATVAWLLS